MLARFSAWGRAVLDVALPPQCPTCETEVAAPGLICAECYRGLRFVAAPLCERCGQALPAAGFGPVCAACLARPPAYRRARAALVYDDAARRLVLPFKHADRTELVLPLAQQMARAGRVLLAQADALVPVPVHRWRLIARRYNQAGLLAQALGQIAGRRVLPTALRRVRATPALGGRGAAERRATVAGVFAVPRPAEVAGRRILLVDDVMTSGATAEACAEVLLGAGALAVDVIAACRVPHPALTA